jgi:hypothetical protein
MVTPAMLIFAILVSMASIGMLLFWSNKLFVGNIQDSLTKIVVLILVGLSALWVIDKLVFVNRNLLNDSQSNGLFELMKSLTILIFGYYFGSQSKKE